MIGGWWAGGWVGVVALRLYCAASVHADSKLVAASSSKASWARQLYEKCARSSVKRSRAERRDLAHKRRQELVLYRLLGLERSELLLERGVLLLELLRRLLELLRRPQPEHEHLERERESERGSERERDGEKERERESVGESWRRD